MSSRRLGGGLKTDSGASAPVLPPPFFSTRQVFILTTLNKLLFMVKTLSWNQTMANKFRKSFAIRFSFKIGKACVECAAFARDEGASHCEIF